MSIDARGRAAAAELRTAIIRGGAMSATDVIESVSRERRHRRTAVSVVTTVLVLALAGVVVGRVLAISATPPAAVAPSPSASAESICDSPDVICAGQKLTFTALPTPVTITLPSTFDRDAVSVGTTLVEAATDGRHGVTILERVIPVQWKDPSAVDPAAGSTAASMASWLAHRPFVQPTKVRHVSVGGRDGYAVDVSLRPGAALPATKAGAPAALTFLADEGNLAVSESLRHSHYVLVDVPYGGVAVIWSWTFGGPETDLVTNQPLADSVRFG